MVSTSLREYQETTKGKQFYKCAVANAFREKIGETGYTWLYEYSYALTTRTRCIWYTHTSARVIREHVQVRGNRCTLDSGSTEGLHFAWYGCEYGGVIAWSRPVVQSSRDYRAVSIYFVISFRFWREIKKKRGGKGGIWKHRCIVYDMNFNWNVQDSGVKSSYARHVLPKFRV